MRSISFSARLCSFTRPAVLAFLLGLCTAHSQAETDSAQTGQGGNTTFTPTYAAPANNLLLGLTASTIYPNAAEYTGDGSAGVAALTNGVFGPIGAPNGTSHPSFALAQQGDYLIYTFAQPSTITSVVTLGGWNDSGRNVQYYTVLYQVSGVAGFTTLANVNYDPGTTNVQWATQVVLNGTDFDPIDNVTAVEFVFHSSRNSSQGYAELAVVGTPNAVPEPSTWAAALGGVGLLGLVLRRRDCRT